MTHEEANEIKRLFLETTEALRLKFDEKAEETCRHMDVVAESLRGEIRVVAEGVEAANERLDRHEVILTSLTSRMERVDVGQQAIESRMGNVEKGQRAIEGRMGTMEEGQRAIESRMTGLEGELHGHRDEMRHEFQELKSQIHLSYAVLDERVVRLEGAVAGLQERVQRIEARLATPASQV